MNWISVKDKVPDDYDDVVVIIVPDSIAEIDKVESPEL